MSQESNFPPYIILTPIGKHKQYSLEEFFTNISQFNPQPKEVVVCVGPDTLVE